jgi:hypothetical protein
MKKLLLMALVLSSLAWADTQVKYAPKIETVKMPYSEPKGSGTTNDIKFYATTMCIDGFLFAVSTHYKEKNYQASSGMAMVQVFAPGGGKLNPPQPVRCEK